MIICLPGLSLSLTYIFQWECDQSTDSLWSWFVNSLATYHLRVSQFYPISNKDWNLVITALLLLLLLQLIPHIILTYFKVRNVPHTIRKNKNEGKTWAYNPAIYSDAWWAILITPAIKFNGKVKLWGDHSCTVNRHLSTTHIQCLLTVHSLLFI